MHIIVILSLFCVYFVNIVYCYRSYEDFLRRTYMLKIACRQDIGGFLTPTKYELTQSYYYVSRYSSFTFFFFLKK